VPKIELTPTHLLVKLSHAEKVWAFRGNLKIPGAAIRGAQPLGTDFWKRLGVRVPGTALPGVIIAGTYLWRRDRAFVYWSRTKGKNQPLEIRLGKGFGYDRLVIGVADAKALADEINDAITAC